MSTTIAVIQTSFPTAVSSRFVAYRTGNGRALNLLGLILTFSMREAAQPPWVRTGTPAFSANSGGAFVPAAFELDAFVGESIQVRFHVGWDCGNCDILEGWYVDDVRGCGTVPVITFLDPSADDDSDGLNNSDELALGTDPLSSDTDGGGLEDGEEVAVGSDAFDPGDDVTTDLCRRVGIFADALPIGKSDPGCLREPGQWIASEEEGVYVLGDSWGDVWQNGDNFTFAYDRVDGNFDLIAHIVERNPAPGTQWGKLGLMARQDTTFRSRHAYLHEPMKPNAGPPRTVWGGRPTHGGADDFNNEGSVTEVYDWMRLERVGDSVRGYGSHDGGNWVLLGSMGWPDAPDTMLVGLAVSGFYDAGAEPRVCSEPPTVARFDEVELIKFDDNGDCNADGTADWCQIRRGDVQDANDNGVPDECDPTRFIRGDGNGDGLVNLADSVFIFKWLFSGGRPPSCLDAVDTDDIGSATGNIVLTDGIFLLNWLFLGGAEPPAPGPFQCGPDLTEDRSDCFLYNECL